MKSFKKFPYKILEDFHVHTFQMDGQTGWKLYITSRKEWVSEWAIFQLYDGENKLIFNEMMMRFALDQHTELDCYSASSLKQQSSSRHVTPFRHIILIPSQPVFALSPYCCMLSGEATNTNFIVFGFTRPGLEPTIYHTPGQ
jgi:hypothetical protein